jgi:anti-anti-sigma factor
VTGTGFFGGGIVVTDGPGSDRRRPIAGAPFDADTVVDGDRRAVVCVKGEIDMTTAPAFGEVVMAAVTRPGAPVVEVDLGGVEFMDSTGITVLVRCYREADGRGRRLVVTRPRPVVLRVLRTAGVADLLGLTEADPPETTAPPAPGG